MDVPLFEDGDFPAFASESDIFYCFKLILGRFPQKHEWVPHSGRTGEPLVEVVKTYLNSAEFHNRSLMDCHENTVKLVEFDGFHLYASPDDSAVGNPLICTGEYEPHVSRWFRERLKPGMRVLDVGANIGFYTLLAASIVGAQGEVIAVEPNPDNVSMILASQAYNNFANIRIVQAAAHDRWDTLCLCREGSNGVLVSVHPEEPGTRRNTVMALPMDAVLRGEAIDLVKIDVEGSEGLALRGMSEMMNRCRPTVFSEFTPNALPLTSGMSAVSFLEFFTSRGYRIQVLNRDGIIDCGNDASRVMTEYERGGMQQHIDILCECAESPVEPESRS